MIQFQVPQFIETEDKIVGPLTLKQFVYIGSLAAVASLLLFVLDFFVWMFAAAILGGIAASLAFGKYNGRPITIFLRSLFRSIWSPSVYVFEAKSAATSAAPKPITKIQPSAPQTAPKPDYGGIKNLWQAINTTKTAIPRREKALPSQAQSFSQFKERFEAVREITGEREVAKRVDYR